MTRSKQGWNRPGPARSMISSVFFSPTVGPGHINGFRRRLKSRLVRRRTHDQTVRSDSRGGKTGKLGLGLGLRARTRIFNFFAA